MSGAAQISMTGNATGDAEVRNVGDTEVANFTLAVTPREKQPDGSWGDGQAAFYRVAAWRKMAGNVGASVKRGTRLTVVGELKPREFEHNGEKRISLDVTATSVALDLTFDPAAHRRGERTQQPAASDPWAAQPTGYAPAPAPAGSNYPEPAPF